MVPGHHPLERLREVVQQVPAVSDLDRLGRALPCAVGIHARAIAADDRHLRPAREPGRRAGRAPVGQQIKEAVLVQIDEDRAIALATAQGKLIHAHAARATRRSRRLRTPDQPQQAGEAHREAQAPTQAHSRPAAHDQTQDPQQAGQAGGPPRVRRD